MLMLGRMLTMAMAMLGGIFFSQAPEFTQQYRQRIGGALDELRAVITRFDNEANRNGLDRQKALGLYAVSPEQFLRAQGGAMQHNFDRYAVLDQQNRDLQDAAPIAKPFVILRNPDPDLITNAWRDFNPGVPVSMAGIVWAAIGLIAGWLIAALFGTASLRRAHVKRGPRRKDEDAVPASPPRQRIVREGDFQPVDVSRQAERADKPAQQEIPVRRMPREIPHQQV
jgi:hypothetical protein